MADNKQKPVVLGLTGSIATGKSTVARMFAKRDIPIYDADKAVHELYAGEAVEAMRELFPDAIIDGKIDRTALSKQVVGQPKNLAKLEALIHPMVQDKMHQFLAQAAEKNEKLAILEIPLLFETGRSYPTDFIAVTFCDPDIQKQRALARDGMSEEKFNAIVARQMPQMEKRARADFEIDTGTSLEATQSAVDEIIKACLAAKAH
ncbi:dephospho-CoA kinase [Maritalea mediterranea]|uniref:Dephospho-CoA kinase n=1 Tax=Maritalea mediterranea TaxID=2909667 RepID=A0ABS9E3Z8_9HYPH|nr:dephospho-CoA kinase [Maritalea mediterranea]MCF4096922.1 dephospho-CoA kinase [Maritalea mediterranea]